MFPSQVWRWNLHPWEDELCVPPAPSADFCHLGQRVWENCTLSCFGSDYLIVIVSDKCFYLHRFIFYFIIVRCLHVFLCAFNLLLLLFAVCKCKTSSMCCFCLNEFRIILHRFLCIISISTKTIFYSCLQHFQLSPERLSSCVTLSVSD